MQFALIGIIRVAILCEKAIYSAFLSGIDTKKTDFHVDTPLRGWAKLRLEEVREMLRIGE